MIGILTTVFSGGKICKNPVLKGAYKSASDKKTFVWAVDEFIAKAPKVLESKDKYFLITKNPIDMKKILVDAGIVPSDVKTVIIGPCNDRPGATKLGNNQSITQEEADALEAITKAGYEVEFALLKETAIGNWKKFRGQFGYTDYSLPSPVCLVWAEHPSVTTRWADPLSAVLSAA